MKNCPFCGAEVVGKKQKRFCNDDHRNRYNSLMWLERIRRKAIWEANKGKKKRDMSCPVNCGHDDSSWCNEEQVAEYRRVRGKK